MKKFRFFLMAFASVAVLFTGCNNSKEEPEPQPSGSVTVTLAEVVDAASAAYAAWEENEKLPETFKVGTRDFSTPEYQFAICKALVNINAGDKGDITVVTYKPASSPDKDSYDRETMAVANGPKNGDETEDLVNVATRMLARMASDLQVPNQTNFTRNNTAIAFSTNRATLAITRELASYKKNGKLDSEVSVGYQGSGNSIKAFAQEYVKVIDEWEKNVGTLDRLSNWELAEDEDKDIVENAHYVPNDFVISFGDKVLSTGDMLEIALRSYLLLRGYDGNDTDGVGYGTFPDVTPVKMSAIAPESHGFGWNMPLIETSNGGYLYKKVDGLEVYGQVDPIILDNWAQRALNYSFGNDMKFSNFCTYPRDPINNYGGCFSSGRALLTYAFFFKYMLDNNLDSAAELDETVAIRSELFGLDTANNDKDIQVKTEELEFDCAADEKEAVFVAKAAWTAETSDSWITVNPASGEAGTISVKVSVAENKGDAREGKVLIKGGNVTDGAEILVKQAEWVEPNKATIKEFAQEYVKILDVWATTTGTIDMVNGEKYEGGSNNVENAHYVPSTTTITVGTREYNTADMLELALRSYLLVRGYDGLDTKNYGAGKIATLTDGAKAMSETTVPEAHGYTWGANPFNESGSYNATTGANTGNGGHLFKWDGTKEIHCQVDPLILDNWAQRSLNYSGGKPITNLCGYPRDPFNNYYGCFSSQRALITYAFFFKYMLDNNLDKADGLGADVIIQSELFGDEEGSKIETPSTIKDFAEEYVKILDIWENTTGTIDMLKGENYSGGDWNVKNAHYVPSTTTIKVGDKTYNTADMLETALRSYLLVRGYDGNYTASNGANSHPALTGGAVAMSETKVPATHDYKWGTSPYNETTGNGGHFVMGTKDNNEPCQVKVDALDNWSMRSLNYPIKNGAISNLCGYTGGQLAGYYGCFCAQRALITYAFFFKYMLDNKLEKADALKDEILRTELFGDEGKVTPFKAEWEFSADAMKAYKDNFGGTDGIKDKTAGDGGLFIDSNVSEGGKITYVQVDKTSLDTGNNARRLVGGTGHPFVYGPWTGDYWLFSLSNGKVQPAGAKVHIKYITRVSKSGPRYWVVEYLDGSDWKPAMELSTAEEDTSLQYNVKMADDGSTNVTVDATFTTTAAMTTMQVRMRCAGTYRADNGKALTAVNGGTCRIAGAAAEEGKDTTSPIFEVVE